MRKFRYKSFSEEQTRRVALGFIRDSIKERGPIVVGLKGNLGTGKTVFVQTCLKFLGVKKKIASPTFVLLKEYAVKRGKFRRAYHIDLYRLKKPTQIFKLGLAHIREDKQAVVFIEWADKIKKYLKNGVSWVIFEHGKNPLERVIKVVSRSK